MPSSQMQTPFPDYNITHLPGHPNQTAFIPEMHNLLTTLCSTSANNLILGNMSCHSAAQFLQLLGCLNLTQRVNVPIKNRGHTLDLVITYSASINNLQVLGVSDHKLISLELPFLSPHSKPKGQICFHNINSDDLGSSASCLCNPLISQ